MRGQIESLLERGIAAARAGEDRRARDNLITVIELDQRNEQAWLWLSSVVESTADKIVCLENVLFINPNNAHATAGLRKLRQQPTDEAASRSMFPRLGSPQESGKKARKTAAGAPVVVTERVCPRCGFRNPGWAYLCDRCGADLQPFDVREAIGRGSTPRGRSFITLVEAWLAAFIMHRQWAFLPELELASWGRSLAALVMAAFFAVAWRAFTTVVLQLWISGSGLGGSIIARALSYASETMRLALLLALADLPIALLTWSGARLAGGRQRFKTHAHLTTVAFSAWIVLIALVASLLTLAPHVVGNGRLLTEAGPIVLGAVAGLMGIVWLTQVVRTAHRLPPASALLIALMVMAVSSVVLLGLLGLGLLHVSIIPYTQPVR